MISASGRHGRGRRSDGKPVRHSESDSESIGPVLRLFRVAGAQSYSDCMTQ